MSFVRPMRAEDLFLFNTCNLDHLTETFHVNYYLDYFGRWPNLCKVIEGADGRIEAYLLGKLEKSSIRAPVEPWTPATNEDPNYLPWHGHVTALTVAPHARRKGHASRLTTMLEMASEQADAWFVDLFVRTDNEAAINLYKRMGYTIYRTVTAYYSDKTDAYDMRKPLKREKELVDPDVIWRFASYVD
jgi:N-terminal acetyltransferase B complex catalytic subunit